MSKNQCFKLGANLATARAADVGVGVLRSQTDSWSLARASVSWTGLVQRKLLGDGCEKSLDVLSSLG